MPEELRHGVAKLSIKFNKLCVLYSISIRGEGHGVQWGYTSRHCDIPVCAQFRGFIRNFNKLKSYMPKWRTTCHFGSVDNSPQAFNFRCSVLSPISRIFAALVRFPPVISISCCMCCFSNSANVGNLPSWRSRGLEKVNRSGAEAGVKTLPSSNSTADDMMFSSSRTLPGKGYRNKRSAKSWANFLMLCWFFCCVYF